MRGAALPKRVRLALLLCATAFSLVLPAAGLAQTQPDTPPPASQPGQDYPGIEQLAPLTAVLTLEAAQATSKLEQWDELTKLKARLDENQQSLLALDQILAGSGSLDQWSDGYLQGTRQRLVGFQTRLRTQLEQLTLLFKSHEELRAIWSDRLIFWAGWQQAVQKDRGKIPVQTFRQNRALIDDLLDRTAQGAAVLTDLQQKLVAQQAIVTSWLTQVEQILTSQRSLVFERNAPPLYSAEFFAQFTSDQPLALQEERGNTLSLPEGFGLRQGWVIILQLLGTLGIAWSLYRRAHSPRPIPEKLQFLFRHPLAGGLFIALIGGGLLYISPPPLWQWLLRVLGTLAATVLICAMLERPRLRRVIITLAVLYVCVLTIRMIGLAQPLHRLFLIGVCVIATPLCLAAAKRQLKRNGGRLDLLAAAFYVGTLSGIVGLVAQVAGYSNLTNYLVSAVLGSTFVFLFARMALYLGSGGIEAVLGSEKIRDQRFLQRLGPGIGPRLNGLLRVVVVSYAILYLLVHWQSYHTPGDALAGIMAISFQIGELTLSMEIVLMVAFVLYLALILSWAIQALLDAEVLTPQGMEFGVKMAVKTLVHYSLILLGFLVAISVAGVDMSKFAVLAGALGVGIGFGLQNIVNNFLSGLIILFERPVKVGDMISLEDQWGTITRIGLRATVVETMDRSEVIVPNSELISERVTNWTFTSHVVRIVLPVGVAYGTPLERVLATLLVVAGEHAEVLDDPAPSALFIGFGDSAINFELRVWVADVNQRLRVRSELGLAIDQKFRAAGIVIPFPQRDLHLQSIAPAVQESLNPGGRKTAAAAKDPSA